MLGWLKQLMSGNQNPEIPNDATVKRDEQGRISEVSMTLGSQNKNTNHSTLQTSDGFQKELDSASKELVIKNISLIQKGIGLEQSYDFNQDTNELTFNFTDGKKITAHGEVIASFDPSPGSFLWAWANPSISTTKNSISFKLRQKGETRDEALLLEAKQTIKFKLITQLMAYAVREGKFDGIYRAFTNGAVSVFIAYNLKLFKNANGNAISFEEFMHPSNEDLAPRASEHCVSYDNEMFAIDKNYNDDSQNTDKTKMNTYLDLKDKVYVKYWERDDEYWRPCSFSWPSDHDLDNYRIKFSGPANKNEVLIGKIDDYRKMIYVVKLFDGKPKIIDQLIEWGSGFIWPDEN